MSKKCPKCGHQRQPGEPQPEWQCPGCGVAYDKVSGEQGSIYFRRGEDQRRRSRRKSMIITTIVVIGLLLWAANAFVNKMHSLKLEPKLELISLQCENVNEFMVLATGELKNISNSKVKYLLAQVEFRNKEGIIVDVSGTVITSIGLAPGQSASFGVAGQGGNLVTTCNVIFITPQGSRIVHQLRQGLAERALLRD